MGDVSPPEAAPNRRCQARPLARLYEYCMSHNASLAWCSGNPLWWRCDTYSIELTHVDSQSQLTNSRCFPLLYPSQSAGSISSCPQLTLTEVTHFVDPWSGSPVTLGHSAPNNNTRDVISKGFRTLAWSLPEMYIYGAIHTKRKGKRVKINKQKKTSKNFWVPCVWALRPDKHFPTRKPSTPQPLVYSHQRDEISIQESPRLPQILPIRQFVIA